MPTSLSIILPVYREADSILSCLARVKALPRPGPLEILVVDGEPEAGTLDVLRAAAQADPTLLDGVTLLTSGQGRARQMNVGAAKARGDILLFLHADTHLPRRALLAASETLGRSGNGDIAAGAFRLTFASTGNRLHDLLLGLTAFFADQRNRLLQTPYGDQALFLRAGVFRGLGGFPEIPIMEDVALTRLLKERGMRLRVLGLAVATSPRRYQEEGYLRTVTRNLTLRLRYALGADPAALAKHYRARHTTEP